MKFSRKMYLMIILKVTKNQGFTLSLEDTFFEKPQGGGQFDPPAVLGLKIKTAKTPSLRKRTINVFLDILSVQGHRFVSVRGSVCF